MLVVANQKGYVSPGGKAGMVEEVVIEAGEHEWKVVIGVKESKKPQLKAIKSSTQSGGDCDGMSRARMGKGNITGSEARPTSDAMQQPGRPIAQDPATRDVSAWRIAAAKMRKVLRLK